MNYGKFNILFQPIRCDYFIFLLSIHSCNTQTCTLFSLLASGPSSANVRAKQTRFFLARRFAFHFSHFSCRLSLLLFPFLFLLAFLCHIQTRSAPRVYLHSFIFIRSPVDCFQRCVQRICSSKSHLQFPSSAYSTEPNECCSILLIGFCVRYSILDKRQSNIRSFYLGKSAIALPSVSS